MDQSPFFICCEDDFINLSDSTLELEEMLLKIVDPHYAYYL